jgi:hypothetical protein
VELDIVAELVLDAFGGILRLLFLDKELAFGGAVQKLVRLETNVSRFQMWNSAQSDDRTPPHGVKQRLKGILHHCCTMGQV